MTSFVFQFGFILKEHSTHSITLSFLFLREMSILYLLMHQSAFYNSYASQNRGSPPQLYVSFKGPSQWQTLSVKSQLCSFPALFEFHLLISLSGSGVVPWRCSLPFSSQLYKTPHRLAGLWAFSSAWAKSRYVRSQGSGLLAELFDVLVYG